MKYGIVCIVQNGPSIFIIDKNLLKSQDLSWLFYYGGYMIKNLISRIEKAEKEKQKKVIAQAKIQTEIDNIDLKLKKLNSFKKDYEKLESNFTEFINNK